MRSCASVFFACPGCNLMRLGAVGFYSAKDARCALVIVGAALLLPLLLYALGLRTAERKPPTLGGRLALAGILFFGWLVAERGDRFYYPFAVPLLYWLHLPLTVQYNVLLLVLWNHTDLMVIPALIVPAAYCWWLAGWLLRRDRVLRWRVAARSGQGAAANGGTT